MQLATSLVGLMVILLSFATDPPALALGLTIPARQPPIRAFAGTLAVTAGLLVTAVAFAWIGCIGFARLPYAYDRTPLRDLHRGHLRCDGHRLVAAAV